MDQNKVKVAAVQAGSILFDREACLTKVEHMVANCQREGAQIVLFPEAMIPGYPRGMGFGTVVGSRSEEGRMQWLKYFEQAVEVPGPSVDRLAAIAGRAKILLAIGVVEKDPVGGTLYCSILYFGPDGRFLGKHRKLKPTASERVIWGEGHGDTLTTLDTRWGRVGGLICWENYMPLARMAMYRQGVGIYLAPTADQRERWQASMRHIALEGRCFVISCNQYVSKEMYQTEFRNELNFSGQIMSRGGSVIVSPSGELLAGPLWDEEGILFAELDLNQVAMGKMDFDVIGHYARNDVFGLSVSDMPEPIIVD